MMILTGTCAADVDFQTFDPDLIRTCWTLRRKAYWLPGPDRESGLTDEELRLLIVQCSRCKRLVSRTSHHCHQCPSPCSNSQSKPDDVLEEPEVCHSPGFRLDALGGREGYLQHGLTQAEFEELFFRCMGCNRNVMVGGRYTHICSYSEAQIIPEDEDFPDATFDIQ